METSFCYLLGKHKDSGLVSGKNVGRFGFGFWLLPGNYRTVTPPSEHPQLPN